MAKRRTNEELVSDLMNFGPAGALQQAFVLTAIEKYAQQCIAAGPEAFDSGLISGRAWIIAAEHMLAELKNHYGA